MVVLIMQKASASLRGEVSRLMHEVDCGVFVGNINRLVREELWKFVLKKIAGAEAVMLWSTNNEQGFNLCSINKSNYIPENFEGIWLFGKIKREKK